MRPLPQIPRAKRLLARWSRQPSQARSHAQAFAPAPGSASRRCATEPLQGSSPACPSGRSAGFATTYTVAAIGRRLRFRRLRDTDAAPYGPPRKSFRDRAPPAEPARDATPARDGQTQHSRSPSRVCAPVRSRIGRFQAVSSGLADVASNPLKTRQIPPANRRNPAPQRSGGRFELSVRQSGAQRFSSGQRSAAQSQKLRCAPRCAPATRVARATLISTLVLAPHVFAEARRSASLTTGSRPTR